MAPRNDKNDMTEFLSVDPSEIFLEIVELGRAEGISTHEAYIDLVDEIIERHRGLGEMHDDSSTVARAEALRGRFEEYLAALGLETEQPRL